MQSMFTRWSTRSMAAIAAVLGIANLLNFAHVIDITGTPALMYIRCGMLLLALAMPFVFFINRSREVVLLVVVPWVLMIGGITLSTARSMAEEVAAEEATPVIPAASAPTHQTDFGSDDFSAIVEAARHNWARFDHDYKGYHFSATGTLDSVNKSLLSEDYVVAVDIGFLKTAYCRIPLDTAVVAKWPPRVPIQIAGDIIDTTLGQLGLTHCTVRRLDR